MKISWHLDPKWRFSEGATGCQWMRRVQNCLPISSYKGPRNVVQRVADHDALERTVGDNKELQVFLSVSGCVVIIQGTPKTLSLNPLVRIQVVHFMEVLSLAVSKTSGKLRNGSTKPELALMWLVHGCQGSGLPPSQINYFSHWETYGRKESILYNQECNQREAECEVCGCKAKNCDCWRHLGTTKQKDRVENGGGGVGEIWVAIG